MNFMFLITYQEIRPYEMNKDKKTDDKSKQFIQGFFTAWQP